ncbi:MAG: hypothetical protein M3Q73_03710 [bacterium]|nr:hypothetical protein [bacterium]
MDSNNVPPEKKSARNPVQKLRTFKDDIINLIRQNAVSPADLKNIDPRLIQEAQTIQADEEIKISIPKANPAKATPPPPPPHPIPPVPPIVPKPVPPPPPKAPEPMKPVSPSPIMDKKDPFIKLNASDKFIRTPLSAMPHSAPKPVPPPPPKPVPPPAPKPVPPPAPKPVPPPPPPKPKEISLLEKLIQEEKDLKAEIEKQNKVVENLETKRFTLDGQIAKLLEDVRPIRSREVELEASDAATRRQESAAAFPNQLKELEQKRWKVEDERHSVEQQRYMLDRQVTDLQHQVKDLTTGIDQAKASIHSVTSQIDRVHRKQAALKAEEEKKILAKDFDAIEASKANLEKQWISIKAERKELEEKHAESKTKEKALFEEIAKIEAQEQHTLDIDELHTKEELRYAKEKELRNVEQTRLTIEEVQQTNEEKSKAIEQQSADILSKEKTLKEKIHELDKVIQAGD